ncbi:MAG: caspase family protein, partial [Sphaerochaetaceae bacterium]|nr:caspase family protein [Sphaerochaetaceae bacterium]
MKRFVLISLLFILICITSCELFYDEPNEGKINILVYGCNFRKKVSPNHSVNYLSNTINDAVQMGKALEQWAIKNNRNYTITYCLGDGDSLDRYYKGYNDNKTQLSVPTHKNATKNEFINQLKILANNSREQDTTIIYMSTHGVRSSNDVSTYGTDLTNSTSVVFSQNGIDNYELYSCYELINDIQNILGVKLLIADFCYSGSLINGNYVSINSDTYSTGTYALKNNLEGNREKVSVDPSLFIITATNYKSSSYENILGFHGYFTQALLDGLGWDEENGVLKKYAPAQK